MKRKTLSLGILLLLLLLPCASSQPYEETPYRKFFNLRGVPTCIASGFVKGVCEEEKFITIIGCRIDVDGRGYFIVSGGKDWIPVISEIGIVKEGGRGRSEAFIYHRKPILNLFPEGDLVIIEAKRCFLYQAVWQIVYRYEGSGEPEKHVVGLITTALLTVTPQGIGVASPDSTQIVIKQFPSEVSREDPFNPEFEETYIIEEGHYPIAGDEYLDEQMKEMEEEEA